MLPRLIKYILVLFFLCSFSKSIAQEVSGIIYFDNGSYLEFNNMVRIYGIIAQGKRANNNGVFKIFYNNSIRIIPLTDLKYIRVKRFQKESTGNGFNFIKSVRLQIETKRKLNFETPYFELYWVVVETEDEFKGDNLNPFILFNDSGKLNIRKIVFD